MKNEKVEILSIEDLKEPKYIKPKLVKFRHNGILRDWEIADTHDSVAILLYHKEKDALVLVKQFRPAIYVKYGGDGETYELCAGLIDKDKSIKEIAKEEIEEECGYRVLVDDIKKVASYNTAVGFAGGRQTLFFSEIDESMRVSDGGGIDDEQIEVLYLPLKEAKEFMFDESYIKTPGLLFGFMWFFNEYGK